MSFHLAQINIGRLHRPLDEHENAEFVAGLDHVNAIAESSSGFIWRLKDDDGLSSSYVRLPGEDDPLLIVNYSIWEDLDALRHFIYRGAHNSYLRRRREWFEEPTELTTVLWWIPAGTVPSLAAAYDRLKELRADGPSPRAWSLSKTFPPPIEESPVP
jgi:hypothetical protein